jgi:hypothetical protein
MQNAFGKLVTLSLLGSGFVATGDLGWLARRGMLLLEASTVPSEARLAEASTADTASHTAAPTGGPPAGMPPASPLPMANTPVAPAPWYAARPPAGGPAFVEPAALEAGSRLFVWIDAGPASGSPHRCLALDIVDPAAGAALLHRGTEPPRRVTILPIANASLFTSRGPSGRIVIRGTFRVVPTGLAHASTREAAAETIGPVVALAVAP